MLGVNILYVDCSYRTQSNLCFYDRVKEYNLRLKIGERRLPDRRKYRKPFVRISQIVDLMIK